MQEWNKEQLDFIYKTIDCKMYNLIRERHYVLSKQDKEDVRSFVLEQIVKRWQNYDPKKAKWNTYVVICINSCLASAWQWLWRFKWRLPMETLTDDDEIEVEAPQTDDAEVKSLIDDLTDDDKCREIIWLRYQGYTWLELQKLGYKKARFNEASQILKDLKRGKKWAY